LDSIAIPDILYYTGGMEKFCPRCKKVSLFRPRRENKERLATICVACLNLRHQRDVARRQQNIASRVKQRQAAKRYRDKNKGKGLAHNASRRSRKLLATPSWANLKAIEQIYNLANRERQMTGFKVHVDHIVPLNSPIVCGLHVEINLQITLADYNQRKSNKAWPGMP
jgi:5-methylcytosine-specific restriction endonuclease McrA